MWKKAACEGCEKQSLGSELLAIKHVQAKSAIVSGVCSNSLTDLFVHVRFCQKLES